jgi:hypothetical protein
MRTQEIEFHGGPLDGERKTFPVPAPPKIYVPLYSSMDLTQAPKPLERRIGIYERTNVMRRGMVRVYRWIGER